MTARELFSFHPPKFPPFQFTFSFRVACFSILAADSSGLCDLCERCHPIAPVATLSIRRSKVCRHRGRRAASADRPANRVREGCSCGQELFSRKVRHVVKPFPFFSFFFFYFFFSSSCSVFFSRSPCCHSFDRREEGATRRVKGGEAMGVVFGEGNRLVVFVRPFGL